MVVGRRKLGASASRIVLSLLTASAALGLSGHAWAHGGIARAFEILDNPERPEQFVLRSDVWGFFHSSDGGKAWQWSCSRGYGAITTITNRVEMVLTAKGRLVVANGFDGVFYTDDFCNWSRATGLDPEPDASTPLLLKDTAVFSDGTVMALTSTGSDAGLLNTLWASQNDGASFSPAGEVRDPEASMESLAQAPSLASRIYVSASVGEKSVLFRSDDGGTSYVRLDGPPLQTPRTMPRIHAVHPTNPDVVFLWLDTSEGLDSDAPDQIWATWDAGNTWTSLVESLGDMPGFAISPDGKTLAVSGPIEGVRRGTLANVMARGGSALGLVNPLPAWGLLWNQSGLYAGKDDFPVPRSTPEKFTLGISHDEGATFDELVNVCEFQFSRCSPGTMGFDRCADDWEDPDPFRGGFKQDHWTNTERCVSEPDAGAPSNLDAGVADAGAEVPATPEEKKGCSCSTPGTRAPSGALVALALGVVGFGLLRRRP